MENIEQALTKKIWSEFLAVLGILLLAIGVIVGVSLIFNSNHWPKWLLIITALVSSIGGLVLSWKGHMGYWAAKAELTTAEAGVATATNDQNSQVADSQPPTRGCWP
ncbi:MAG: hypothetical protein WC480_04270 [Patescibacteria group bacterium]